MIKKRSLMIVLIVVALLVFQGCTNNNSQAETRDPVENNDVSETENTSENEPIDKTQILSDSAITNQEKNLYFEYTLSDETGTTADVNIYLTPEFIRGEVNPETETYTVIVFNLTDETAFTYIPAQNFAGEFTSFPMFETLTYQDQLTPYGEDISNLERQTLNGYPVVYGEVDVENDHLTFWYSEEFGVMLKFIIDSDEYGESTYEVTHIEFLNTVDSALFEKPEDMTFFDMGDGSGFLPENLPAQ